MTNISTDKHMSKKNNSYLFYNSKEKGKRTGIQVSLYDDPKLGKLIHIIFLRVKKKRERKKSNERIYRKFWFGDLVISELVFKENTIWMEGNGGSTAINHV